MTHAARAEIFEVGPRDGLQNLSGFVPTDQKIALIQALMVAGFRRIETASFVSPKWVPQMADGAAVMAAFPRETRAARMAGLTPNLKGFEGAVAAQMDEVAVFASASEGFSQANLNCSIEESIARFAPIFSAAKVENVKVRGYISCVTDCPFDGETPPDHVAAVAQKLVAMGCYEISLGDTLGRATPDRIDAMLTQVTADLPAHALAGHFHDTSGRALENVTAALRHGVRVFDASIGGLGGCPYAPGAAGNVDTLALHDHLTAAGFDTGLDRAALVNASVLANDIKRAAMAPNPTDQK